MILQIMHIDRLRNMPPVFPVPHLKMGKIPFPGQQDTERTFEEFYGTIRQFLPLKLKLRQLLFIQRNRIQFVRSKPEILHAGLYTHLFIFPIQPNHFSLRTLAFILGQHDISDFKFMKFDNMENVLCLFPNLRHLAYTPKNFSPNPGYPLRLPDSNRVPITNPPYSVNTSFSSSPLIKPISSGDRLTRIASAFWIACCASRAPTSAIVMPGRSTVHRMTSWARAAFLAASNGLG